MKIYIAGPMTGLPQLNFPAFRAAAAALRADGHTVVNPAELNTDPTASWSDCMRVDIRELVTCDSICLLPDWTKSKGARLEFHIAVQLDMQVLEAATLIPEARYIWVGVDLARTQDIHLHDAVTRMATGAPA